MLNDHKHSLTAVVRESIEWAEREAGYQINLSDLLSPQRYAHLVRIRRLAMWRLRTHYFLSFPRIAKAMHRADHATVMHHVGLENEARGLPKAFPKESNAFLVKQRQEAILSSMNAGAHV